MRYIKNTAVAALLFTMVTILASNPIANAQTSSVTEKSLIGVWRTQVIPRNCDSGVQIMPAFEGLLTINFGGTMAETSSGSAPGTRGPGHGVWKKLPGWQIYEMSFLFQRFSPGGLIGTTVVNQEVQLDATGDAFTSTGTVAIVANDGTVLGSICSTSTGIRFK